MQDLTHRSSYISGLSAAHSHLEQIPDEVKRLSTRRDCLRTALEDFTNSGSRSDRRQAETASWNSDESPKSASISSSNAHRFLSHPLKADFVKGPGSAGEEINRRIHYALGLSITGFLLKRYSAEADISRHWGSYPSESTM